jgi:DNA-binding PadR family transcriptional regulator
MTRKKQTDAERRENNRLRNAVHRSLNQLEKNGLVETRLVPGRHGLERVACLTEKGRQAVDAGELT